MISTLTFTHKRVENGGADEVEEVAEELREELRVNQVALQQHQRPLQHQSDVIDARPCCGVAPAEWVAEQKRREQRVQYLETTDSRTE